MRSQKSLREGTASSLGPQRDSAGSSRRNSRGDSDPSAGGESTTTTTGSSAPLVTTARLREDRRSVSRLMIALAIFSVVSSTAIALSLIVHARFDSRLLASDSHGGDASDTTPKLETSSVPFGDSTGAKKHKPVRHKSTPARKNDPRQASTQKQPHFSIETHAPSSVGANSSGRENNRSTGESLRKTESASQAGSNRAKITSPSYTTSSVNATSSADHIGSVYTISSASKEQATSGISSRDAVIDTNNIGKEKVSSDASSRATLR
ncbi:uncharacterized protein LOC119434748 [Dermacentor silvarum]|uniref:uncharacterized protein LOC119434748 n=1 Tax=Dermacentor silvarum TaxID=543639 RepID=UPI0018979C96|nr:uncharacterized protein LOC119434748 [Dermacentor silvarum]